MAYTFPWDETFPPGTQSADQLNEDLQRVLVQIRERFTDILGITFPNDTVTTVTATKVVLKGSATSKIIPGATSHSIRNNADSADNLLITDAGIVTARAAFENIVAAGLAYLRLFSNGGSGTDWRIESRTDGKLVLRSVTGVVDALVLNSGTLITPWTCSFQNGVSITTGGLNCNGSANFDLGDYVFQCSNNHNIIADITGAAIKGGFRLRRTGVIKAHIGLDASDRFAVINAAENAALFTVDNNGNTVVGANFTVSGGFTLLGHLTFNTITATSKISTENASNISFRNNADSADNVLITDAGVVTIRGTLNASSGLTSTGTIAINIASGTALTSNTTTNAVGDVNQFIFQRGAVNKWRIGTNINGANADDFNIYSDALSVTALSINSTGRVLIGSSSVTSSVSLDIDTGLAVGNATVRFLRSGTQKFRLGMDGGDNFSVFDAGGGTINATVTTNGDINARTGFAVGGAAASGNYLRGNGTRFVSSALQAGDLPTTLTPTILTIGGGQNINRVFSASVAWNPGTINNNNQVATTVTVTGAQVGDSVIASNIWLADNVFAIMQAWVSAINTVTIQITNHSGGAITLTNRTIKVWTIG
jgi:hypothetical protein